MKKPAVSPSEFLRVAGPTLRGLLADGPVLPVVTFDDSPAVLSLVGNRRRMSRIVTAAPARGAGTDGVDFPLVIPVAAKEPSALAELLRQAVSEHKRGFGQKPRVVLVAGLGLFAAGADWREANAKRELTIRAICSILPATRNSTKGRGLTEQGVDYSASGCNCSCASSCGGSCAGRANGKVVVVTGGAQGFGLEIARQLAWQGAHVVLLDINQDGASAAAGALAAQCGPGRALGLAANVTSPDSLASAMLAVIRQYGGFDVFISNAGVLKAGSVKTQNPADFDFVTAVNYKGYFLCVQHAAPVLAAQHAANLDYWSDIIQINSKSGLAGSNRNGAYAGSKFGGIGLTQSFALELVDDNIKVNSICPGNFFDGPLWSDPKNGLFVQYLRAGKVPGAKTVADVRRFYETKVPMRRGCEAPDVVKAILYIMEQTYETGQAVPVTGGQVMLS